ncbi:MAG: hypothetical protein IPL91_16195 [Hyphomicrobium sp.]|nr:hypothetical protein [Hyphomicrobium sp.]
MSSKLTFSAAVVAAGLLAATLPGSAASLTGNLNGLKDAATAQSLIEQTHGWHRSCRRGLNGWHKHVPGVGRIQCGNHRCWRNKWGVRRCVWY